MMHYPHRNYILLTMWQQLFMHFYCTITICLQKTTPHESKSRAVNNHYVQHLVVINQSGQWRMFMGRLRDFFSHDAVFEFKFLGLLQKINLKKKLKAVLLHEGNLLLWGFVCKIMNTFWRFYSLVQSFPNISMPGPPNSISFWPRTPRSTVLLMC